MKKKVFFVIGCLTILSCGQTQFLNEIQGKWKVTEIDYQYDDTTLVSYPDNMTFVFHNDDYQSLVDNAIVESGTFHTNANATIIRFYADLGNSAFNITEKSTQQQSWKSKNKLIDFYLAFKLEKME